METRELITKERAINLLSMPYTTVKAICGEDIISLVNENGTSPMSRTIALYVNGTIKGEWAFMTCQAKETKYLRIKKNRLTPLKKLEETLKGLPKKMRESYIKKNEYEMRTPYFPSGKAVVNHLTKVCPDVAFYR